MVQAIGLNRRLRMFRLPFGVAGCRKAQYMLASWPGTWRRKKTILKFPLKFLMDEVFRAALERLGGEGAADASCAIDWLTSLVACPHTPCLAPNKSSI